MNINTNGIKAWEYKDSLLTFFIDAWKVLEPETPLVLGLQHEVMAEKIEEIFHRVINGEPRPHDTIFNVPPGSTKSTFITIVSPVWGWLWAPHLKFITTSWDDSLAITHALKSRDLINSDWFQETCGHIFQLKYDLNKKSEYGNDKMGLRIAAGVGSNITGKHADIFITDDAMNPKVAASPLQMKTVNTWWDLTTSSRLTNPDVSTRLAVMQRLARNDLTGHCLNMQKQSGMHLYEHICLPAEVNSHIRPKHLISKYKNGMLDEKRFSRNFLKRQKVLLGSTGYAGQYSQTPVSDEGALVDPNWFGRFNMSTLRNFLFDSDEELVIDFYLDGAYTEDKTNDPTSILAAAKVGHMTYIFDVVRVWMELPELLKFIPEFMHRNNATEKSRIIVEPKASGLSIVQMLRKRTKLNVVSDKPPKDSKVQRLKSVLPYIESMRVNLLENSHWIEAYLDELKNFPNVEHDDMVDTTTMCLRRHSKLKTGGSGIFGMSSN